MIADYCVEVQSLPYEMHTNPSGLIAGKSGTHIATQLLLGGNMVTLEDPAGVYLSYYSVYVIDSAYLAVKSSFEI